MRKPLTQVQSYNKKYLKIPPPLSLLGGLTAQSGRLPLSAAQSYMKGIRQAGRQSEQRAGVTGACDGSA